MKDLNIEFKQAEESEFLAVFNFVAECKPLEQYPEHVYKILLKYFNNTCYVINKSNELKGICIGFISQINKYKYFLWQIGVHPKMQGEGVGGYFLEKIEKDLKQQKIKTVELTIDPANVSSIKLFKKQGYKNVSGKEGKTVIINNMPAVKDYYKPGRHFMLFRKTL